MLYDLLLFLPCIACLFWMVASSLLAPKTNTHNLMLAILATGCIFIFSSACCLSPNATPTTLLIGSILRVISAPSLIPLLWLYMMRLRGQGSFRIGQFAWILFPAALGAATIVLSTLAGPDAVREFMPIFYSGAEIPADKTLRTYFFVTGPVHFAIIGIEALIYIILFIGMMRTDNLRFSHMPKFHRGFRLRVPEIQSYYIFILVTLFLITIFIPRMILMHNAWVAIVLSLMWAASFFQMGYISLFGAKTTISRAELLQGFRYNYDAETKAEAIGMMLDELVEEADTPTLRHLFNQIGTRLPSEDLHPVETPAEAPKSPASQIFSAVAKSWDDDSLLSRFEHLIFGKQLYLESGLTLVDVAEKLHTNKTYVSRLVNSTYEMPYPDLINTLRVDYAEQYIVAHRDARQNEIAKACGFSSASSFNNIFKKVTGMTPKIWLATKESQAQR